MGERERDQKAMEVRLEVFGLEKFSFSFLGMQIAAPSSDELEQM